MKLIDSGRLVTDSYNEYMVINGDWEVIGNTRVDLSSYITREDADSEYLKNITAGNGLKVSNKNHIDIDMDTVFVLYGGTATDLI